jgi:hypothetical protein
MMPFSEHRIKYLLREKTGKTLTKLAESWECRLEELSMCIRRAPERVYPELRLKIAEAIGHSVNTVFGPHPLTTAALNRRIMKKLRRQREAA